MLDAIKILLDISLILNVFLIFVVIFFERKNPSSTWAWIFVLSVLPYIGFIFYVVLGLDAHKYKIFMLKAKLDNNLYDHYLNQAYSKNYFLDYKNLKCEKNILKIAGYENLNDLVYMNYKIGLSSVTLNNKINIFCDGKAKFKSLLEDINQAQKFIHMEYYIFREDKLGKRIMDLLIKKAKEGLEVKILFDGMGCIRNSHDFYKNLVDAGGETIFFLPPRIFRVNFRNHRKICVIDGKIGYIGGFNIGDEYIGDSKKFGFWRDSHIKIFGDAARQLELRFIMDWNFCVNNKIALEEKYFPKIKTVGCTSVQIISSGPDNFWESIKYNYFKMIMEANEYIYIQTPYFVPDDSILTALKTAALSGIDVRIMIPSKPDHIFVYWTSLSYIGELLKVGVKCYKYKKGFLHSKLILVDGKLFSVGTANMDIRSFRLNFETNAIIYDQNLTYRLEQIFISDLSDCEQILQEDYECRSCLIKIKESISRLLSPIL